MQRNVSVRSFVKDAMGQPRSISFLSQRSAVQVSSEKEQDNS